MMVWSKFEYRQRTWNDTSLTPTYELGEFQAKVDQILGEFFRSHEATECADALAALDCSRMMDEFVVRAVRSSLEAKGSEEAQRLASGLFRLLHARKQLDSAQLARGFDKLSLTYDDLALDIPSAPMSILQFVDCAVADNCLDANFVARLPEAFLRALSETSAAAGDEMATQLRAVLKDIQAYKKGAASVAEDACAGGHKNDLGKAIVELRMPHLRHEVVRKMVQTSFSQTERSRRAVAKLLGDLRADDTLTEEHVAVGLTRLVGTVDDLILDYPAAAEYIRKFWAWAVLEELVPPAALQAVRRLRIGGPRGIQLVEEVQQWTSDPLATSNTIFSDEVDQMRVNEFRQAVMNAIREYFDAVDAPEFARIVRTLDLEDAAQRIEIARKVVGVALDGQAKDCHAAVALLLYLVEQGDLRQPDVVKALHQLRERLPDLELDVPDAKPILNTFAEKLGVQ